MALSEALAEALTEALITALIRAQLRREAGPDERRPWRMTGRARRLGVV